MLADWIWKGPDIAQDGVVRWRLRDPRERILARFFVAMDERSVGRMLKALAFSHVPVRPRHPQADAEAQEARKKLGATSLVVEIGHEDVFARRWVVWAARGSRLGLLGSRR